MKGSPQQREIVPRPSAVLGEGGDASSGPEGSAAGVLVPLAALAAGAALVATAAALLFGVIVLLFKVWRPLRRGLRWGIRWGPRLLRALRLFRVLSLGLALSLAAAGAGACSSADEPRLSSTGSASRPARPERSEPRATEPRATEPRATEPAAATDPRCPERMSLIGVEGEEAFCIDRYEAALEGEGEEARAISARGRLPADGLSFVDARRACAAAGLRLCLMREWVRACAGPGDEDARRAYPYGREYVPRRCNTTEFGADPSTQRVREAGGRSLCVTPEGVYDLSGNVGEWVDQAEPVDVEIRPLLGGSFGTTESYARCRNSSDGAQPIEQRFSGQGFRCCADPSAEPSAEPSEPSEAAPSEG